MTPWVDPFRDEVVRTVEAVLDEWLQGSEKRASDLGIRSLLSVPPNFALGQAALPCFPFAKLLKVAPPVIATRLAEALTKAAPRLIARVEAVNGYLNFHCDFSKYGADIAARASSRDLFGCGLLPHEAREKIVVEYSQPNTHKALHVGHLRCLFLGDAVARLLEYAGHDVVRATYPGDLGTHVAKVLWYIRNRWTEPYPEHDRSDWLGEMYARAQDEFEKVEGTPAEAAMRAEMGRALAEVDARAGEYYELWKLTRDWSFDRMKEVYAWFGIRFDQWYTESDCDRPSMELVKRKFDEGFFVKDQGAIGIDLSQWKLGFAIFVKSDGHGLYLTKDLELLRQKFLDPKVTRSVYVVDARQRLHFQQLFKTAELMGYPQAARSVHLSYETVNTSDGKAFASRKLNGLRLSDLQKAMESKVKQDYLERYRGDWSDADIDQTAAQVTIGALKYGMLKIDNTTQVTFILDEWLRLDGDTGPYLQYVHARCCNILEKQGRPEPVAEFTLQEEAERQLVFLLGRFNDFVGEAANQSRPSILAGFLLELARQFNRFYENCPIRTAEGGLRHSRLAIVETTAHVMSQGLGLLGIPAPRRM